MPPPGFEPFLETILAEPAADAPRLVYADWLEEQGDPRAEFIRVQCELAGLPEDDPRIERLADRETTLRNTYGELWRAEIPEWARGACEFQRGFVFEVMIVNRWHHHYGPELSRSAPVEKVKLQNLHEGAEEFARGPGVRHLSALAVLDANLDYDALKALTHSEAALAPLQTLQFMGMGATFGDTGALMLSLSPYLARLTRLELIRCGLQARGVQVVIGSRSLTNLQWLDLSDNDLTDDCIWSLVNSESMSHLKHLVLNSNRISNNGVRAVVESPHLGQLTHLDLNANVFGDAAVPLLLERFPNLQRLSVAGNFLNASSALALHAHYGKRVHLGVPGSR